MRRLAGTFIFVVGACLVIYSALWMLLNYKTQAKTPEISPKQVFGVKAVVSKQQTKTVRISNTPTSIPKPSNTPTPTNSPTPTPTISPTQTPVPTPTPTGTQETQGISVANVQEISHTGYILSKINEYRASKGTYAAVYNQETCSFARIRAGEISSNFNHDSFTQKISSNSLPYPSYSLVTENIAMTSNYQDVVDIWINSAPHAENMAKDTPFICVEQNGNYYAYEGWKP